MPCRAWRTGTMGIPRKWTRRHRRRAIPPGDFRVEDAGVTVRRFERGDFRDAQVRLYGMRKNAEKGFLQGLKPNGSRSSTPGLKPRPPKERGLFPQLAEPPKPAISYWSLSLRRCLFSSRKA